MRLALHNCGVLLVYCCSLVWFIHSLFVSAFRDMLNKSDKSEGAFAVRTAKTLIKITNKVHDDPDSSDNYQPIIGKKLSKGGGTSNKTKLMKMIAKLNLLPKASAVK